MTRASARGRGVAAGSPPPSGRNSWLSSGLSLAVGLGLVGLAGYAFVAVVGRTFAADPADVTALTSVYLLTNIVGPGVFVALEQEVSRAVSERLATGRSIVAVARRGAVLGVGLSVIAAAVLVALWWPALDRVLNGRPGLLAAVVVAVAGAGVVYWCRGVFSGQQRFVAYAGTLHLEGGTRLLGIALLLVLAASSPVSYAMVFAVGAGLAGLLMAPALRLGERPAVPDPPGPMARSLVLLVSSTLLMQLVANLGPVVVAYRMPEQAAVAGAFAATFVLARIPLFLFAPVQAMLLPSLTRALTHGDTAAFRRRITSTLLVIAVFGAGGALLGGTVGPWAVRVLLGVPVPPSALVIVALAAATSLMMACQMLQPALVAAGRQRRVVVAWSVGTLVFLGFLVAPMDPIAGAVVAQLVGPAVTAAIAGSALVGIARRRDPLPDGPVGPEPPTPPGP